MYDTIRYEAPIIIVMINFKTEHVTFIASKLSNHQSGLISVPWLRSMGWKFKFY